MKTNIIKKWLPIVAVLSTILSCTDLDVDVKSQYTDGNFPITEADMEALCGPAYTAFVGNYGRWYWHMVSPCTDEGQMVTNAGNWYDNATYIEMSLHNWTSSNQLFRLTWDALFSGISQCNSIISILEASDADTSQAVAEMRTMRALYYFWAMDNFGDVPIVTKLGEETPQRSSRTDAAEFIEEELTEAMNNLTTVVDNTTYAKPTQYMAKALLAKLYLNWAVYTTTDVSNYEPTQANIHLDDVVALCDDIIQSHNFDLTDHWIEKFKDTNGSHIKDFIFVIPFDWSRDEINGTGGLTHFRFWCHKFFMETFGLNRRPGGVMRGVPEFIDLYNLDGDVRNAIWRGGLQYYEGTTTPFVYTLSKGTLDNYYTGNDKDASVDWHFELTKELVIRGEGSVYNENLRQLDLGNDELGLAMGYRNVKFYPTAASSTNWQSNDMPVFRLADILLMKAEAILRGGTETYNESPVFLMNEIRSCAKAPSVDVVTLDEILDERARELADEYWRRNDLIRFGKFEEDWGLKNATLGTSNKDKYRRIFPISAEILALNTHWVQNNGY